MEVAWCQSEKKNQNLLGTIYADLLDEISLKERKASSFYNYS